MTVPTATRDTLIAEASRQGMSACGMLMEPNKAQLDDLLALLKDKQLTIHIDHVYPMNSVVLAHQQLESGHGWGKLCLSMTSMGENDHAKK